MSNVLKMAAVGGAVSAETDPNFNQTVLLLHGDGTNGAQNNTFLDGSTNNFTITRNGNTTQGTFSPFSRSSGNLVNAPYDPAVHGGSGYFDGTADRLTVPSSSALEPGSGNFTIELWFYPLALPSVAQFLVYRANSSGYANFSISHRSTGAIEAYMSLSSPVSIPTLITAGNCPVGSWSHIVYTKNNLTYTLYINGVQVGTLTAASHPPTGLSTLTEISNTTYPVNGYIAGVKIIKGSAVAPSGVPTTPPVDSSGTSLLLNFTNAGIFDNTGKNVLETVADAQIDTTTKKYGTGSMEFDGTGDYLIFQSTPDTYFGTGDFTIEGWFYVNNIATTQVLLERRAAFTARGIALFLEGSTLRLNVGDTSISGWEVSIVSGTLSSSTWYHFALTRSGSTWRGFVNGTQIGSNVTWTGSVVDETSNWLIGVAFNGSVALNGFIDDLRITKGVARYTANFTAPTKAFPDQ